MSGVHPKKKTPGTFTEIPYDKKSMEELVKIELLDFTPAIQSFVLTDLKKKPFENVVGKEQIQ